MSVPSGVRVKALITGAGGMLGSDLGDVFRRLYGESSVVALGRRDLDITSPAALADTLELHRPTLVLNAAGYTNVDRAEQERDGARKANVQGPRNLAALCAERGLKLVHFGTDQVFDGKDTRPWEEEDTLSPANYYAETKLEGEQAVLQFPENLVLRLQWLYGARKDRFTPLRDMATFSPFVDQFGSPSWCLEIAELVGKLTARDARGLFHYSHDDYASWADVYAYVLEVTGWPVRLLPRRTEEAGLPARRPRFSVLSNRKLAAFLKLPGLGSWKTSLARFLKERG